MSSRLCKPEIPKYDDKEDAAADIDVEMSDSDTTGEDGPANRQPRGQTLRQAAWRRRPRLFKQEDP